MTLKEFRKLGKRDFDNGAVLDEIEIVIEERDKLRAALLPFAAAAGRPGRLVNGMNDEPLDDDVVLGIGVKVRDWKRANELMGA